MPDAYMTSRRGSARPFAPQPKWAGLASSADPEALRAALIMLEPLQRREHPTFARGQMPDAYMTSRRGSARPFAPQPKWAGLASSADPEALRAALIMLEPLQRREHPTFARGQMPDAYMTSRRGSAD